MNETSIKPDVELQKIEIKGFYLSDNPNKKYTFKFNFENNNNIQIITGNNGLGKTSLMNLIFGIIQGNSNWYKHVRYREISFKINEEEPIVLESNLELNSLKDIKNTTLYQKNINQIIQNLMLLKQWQFIVNDEYKINNCFFELLNIASTKDEIDYMKNINLNKLIQELNENLKNKNFFEETQENTLISELSEIINVSNVTPNYFFNSILNNISQQINIVHSNMMKFNNEARDKLQEINLILRNKIDYFSSFRKAKDFIRKYDDESKYRDDIVNKDNLTLISFELNKKNVKEINDDLILKIKEHKNKLKSSFFKIISEDDWNEEFIIDDSQKTILRNLVSELKDQDVKNLIENLCTKSVFQKRIQGYIKPFVSELEEIAKFQSRFLNFLKQLNKCLQNKEIKYKDNKLFIKSGADWNLFDRAKLSSGEKQLFLLFQSIFFSNKKIIIIDEPENALSIRWQQIFRDSLDENDVILQNKKFIIITHSPYILRESDINEKRIIQFEKKEISKNKNR